MVIKKESNNLISSSDSTYKSADITNPLSHFNNNNNLTSKTNIPTFLHSYNSNKYNRKSSPITTLQNKLQLNYSSLDYTKSLDEMDSDLLRDDPTLSSALGPTTSSMADGNGILDGNEYLFQSLVDEKSNGAGSDYGLEECPHGNSHDSSEHFNSESEMRGVWETSDPTRYFFYKNFFF